MLSIDDRIERAQSKLRNNFVKLVAIILALYLLMYSHILIKMNCAYLITPVTFLVVAMTAVILNMNSGTTKLYSINMPDNRFSNTDYNFEVNNKNLANAVSNSTSFNPNAMPDEGYENYRLGWSYSIGANVEKNLETAVEYYSKAATIGYTLAQFSLGQCYDFGEGVEKNPEAAVMWYTEAANAGHSGAQHNLGVCYLMGRGTEKCVDTAYMWFQKAAETGHSAAQAALDYFKAAEINKNAAPELVEPLEPLESVSATPLESAEPPDEKPVLADAVEDNEQSGSPIEPLDAETQRIMEMVD